MGEGNGVISVQGAARRDRMIGAANASALEARLLPLVLSLLGAQAFAFWALAVSGKIPPAVLTLFRALLTL
jgi:hypothetical protein